VSPDPRRALAFAQGGYFLTTGIWPLVHMRSFLRVSGPKHDLWLVRTVGALIAVTGAVLVAAARRNRLTAEIELLAAGTAAALGTVDAVYTSRRRIPPIYMLDGAAEAALVVLWLSLSRATSRTEPSRVAIPADACR
jgi:hypothetical protein